MSQESVEADRAFQTHLTEYESARNEITLLTNMQNQLVNYTIAIIAGMVTILAIGHPSIAERYPGLFLIASMLVSALGWAFIEAELKIHDIGNYIQIIIRKKIQILIGHETELEYQVLSWEETKSQYSSRTILRGLTAFGKFAITFIPTILFIFLFLYIRSLDDTPWYLHEKILFTIAAVSSTILHLGLLVNVVFNWLRGKNPSQ